MRLPRSWQGEYGHASGLRSRLSPTGTSPGPAQAPQDWSAGCAEDASLPALLPILSRADADIALITEAASIQHIKRRSGWKLLTLSHGETGITRPSESEPTPLQMALARGQCWLALLEAGGVKSMKEIALKEVDSSYVSRMVNLTILAPDIVTAMLDESLPSNLTLFELAVDPPVLWKEQGGEAARLSLANVVP